MVTSPPGRSVVGKIGPKGQVVIPKDIRDRMGLKPGGSVFLEYRDDDGVLEIRYAWNDPVKDALDHFARIPVRPGMEGRTSLDILHELDREDEEIMEAQYQRWTRPSLSSTPSPSSAPSGRSRSGRSSKGSSPVP